MSDLVFSLIAPRKVRVSHLGVRLFNAQWPCSRLDPQRAYWFEFDADGDLVDTDVPEHSDGPEATALCDDAKAWLDDGTLPDWATF